MTFLFEFISKPAEADHQGGRDKSNNEEPESLSFVPHPEPCDVRTPHENKERGRQYNFEQVGYIVEDSSPLSHCYSPPHFS